jgi:GDP-mannose 6-dehydrogenase
MKISIFGLGYVGAVSAACFAKLGNEVIGVDVVDYKVDAINAGNAPLEEKGLSDLIAEFTKKKKLRAIKNTEEAILDTDVSFVCVGTPPTKEGDIDLAILKRVCEEIGNALRKKKYYLIVIRSTMFPGSLDALINILEKSSGKKCHRDFDIATNPEFLREGSAIKDFFEPPFVVVGADKESAGKKVLNVYKGVNAKKIVVKPEVAQMIKYASNSWHALKITFTNEIAAICKKAGVDSKALMELFAQDSQLNISPYYMKPGFAYGGSCLPKDTAALKSKAEKLGVKTPVISSIPQSNMEQIYRAIELIKSKKKKKIGILGLTFKPDTDDIRGNPILYVINKLLNEGYEIKIFDRLIDVSDIESISESYRKEVFDLIMREDLKENIGTISSLFSDVNSVLGQDVIVVANRDKNYTENLKSLGRDKVVIDLQSIIEPKEIKARYESL